MNTIRCPSCRRILNLPASLCGTEVQCPGCHTNFVPPRADEPHPAIPIAVPVLQAVPVPEPAAGGPAEAFAFNDEQNARHHRVRRKVDVAAGWLRRAVLCDMLATMMCCPCTWEVFGIHTFILDEVSVVYGLLATIVLVLLVMGFDALVLIGSHYLVRRRFRGLVTASAIVALLLALKNAVQTLGLLLVQLNAMMEMDVCFGLVGLIMVGLAVGAAINGFVGGIKTLSVLKDPDVRRDFR